MVRIHHGHATVFGDESQIDNHWENFPGKVWQVG